MANDTFIDLDLRIFKAGPDTFLVTAQTPGSGLASGQLDWAALSQPDFTSLIERIREEPFTADVALFEQVGETLFNALFQGQARDLFISIYSQRVQSVADTHLRLRLDISESAGEVAMLPWEFMHWNNFFLATQVKTLVTRQLLNLNYGNIKSLTVAGKPKVLVVIPRGSGLATDEEETTIRAALTAAELPFEVLKGRVPVKLVDDTLAAGGYHILHFIGHGEFREEDDGRVQGSLRFNASWPEDNEAADEEWVTDNKLQALLGNYEDLKLVVLNACKGAEVETRSGRGFIGAAPAILRAGAPAVVAMQYAIRDDVALQFGETFYKRLTSGEHCGQVDMALAAARNACFLFMSKDRGFATPVLYLRSQDGKIFECEGKSESQKKERPAPVETCPPPPKPEDSLLHDHRHSTAQTLLAAVKSTQEQLSLAQRQISHLQKMKFENPLLAAGGMVDLQIEQLEAQKQKMEQRLEEESGVLRWKLHEVCLEREKQAHKLIGLQEQLNDLQKRNDYVPYSLKTNISDTQKRVRELETLLQQGEAFR